MGSSEHEVAWALQRDVWLLGLLQLYPTEGGAASVEHVRTQQLHGLAYTQDVQLLFGRRLKDQVPKVLLDYYIVLGLLEG